VWRKAGPDTAFELKGECATPSVVQLLGLQGGNARKDKGFPSIVEAKAMKRDNGGTQEKRVGSNLESTDCFPQLREGRMLGARLFRGYKKGKRTEKKRSQLRYATTRATRRVGVVEG